MDRKSFKRAFTLKRTPDWICPKCGKGVLRIKKETFSQDELSHSRDHSHDAWEPEWIEYVYSCLLYCSNANCREVVASTGGIDAEVYQVDLEQTGKDDYRPSFKKIDNRRKALLNEHILTLPRDSQVKNLASRLAEMVGNMYPIPDKEVQVYIRRIIEGLTPEQFHECLERDYSYVNKIKRKIGELATEYSEKVFNDWLTTEKIVTTPHFILPDYITPNVTGPAIADSLYKSEKKANGFEERVINDVANLPNNRFWHKNMDKQPGFRINGFINHYPDFIVKTASGKIILLETKGDDRDNSDSARKLKLGREWEKQAGKQFRYFMVFENKPIDEAYKLVDALGLLGQL